MIDGRQFIADLQKIEGELQANVSQAMGQLVSFAAEHARSSPSFKDKTRTLRGSIEKGQRSGPFHFFIKASAKHALYVEEDTRAHEIRPKLGAGFVGPARPSQGRRGRGRAKTVLTFQIGGRWISKKVVKHPGTTGKHFMQAARDAAESMVDRFMTIAVDRAIRG